MCVCVWQHTKLEMIQYLCTCKLDLRQCQQLRGERVEKEGILVKRERKSEKEEKRRRQGFFIAIPSICLH